MTETHDFDSLGLIEPLLKALQAQGYEKPTPIQASSIPIILSGKDLLGCARTGTGKTAAFALPTLQIMETERKPVAPRSVRMLVLTPTRELAAQVEESFRTYGANTGLRFALAFGGVGKAPQAKALARGVDVLVATPGRLLDLRGDGAVDLSAVEFFVLDEADRMLDMGFIHDMRKVFSFLPKKRHTMLFSATMPKTIKEIAASILTDPAFVSVDPPSAPASGIEQRLYHVSKDRKRALLVKLLTDGSVDRALVFTRTKHLANRVAAQLNSSGVSAEAIHANKSQTHRTKVLAAFKSKEIRVLVATDIAARGIDIDELPHVINFEIPNEPETYVHRIGRTARAGAEGMAFSFCEEEERPYIKAIEKLIGTSIPVSPLPELPELPPQPALIRQVFGSGRSAGKGKRGEGERGASQGDRTDREPERRTAEKAPAKDKQEKRQKAEKRPAPAKEAKAHRANDRDRFDNGRDEAALRKANAAKIHDQIALATGGTEGRNWNRPDNAARRGEDRGKARPEAFRNPARDERRDERPSRGGMPQDRGFDGRAQGNRARGPANEGMGKRDGMRRQDGGKRQDPPKGFNGGQKEREPISDEEAARRAANDPRQPGIIPFNGPMPRENERQGNRPPFGRRGGGRR